MLQATDTLGELCVTMLVQKSKVLFLPFLIAWNEFSDFASVLKYVFFLVFIKASVDNFGGTIQSQSDSDKSNPKWPPLPQASARPRPQHIGLAR